MKKYIRPMTHWVKINNNVLLAGSGPGIASEDAMEDGCAKGNTDADWDWDEDDSYGNESNYWGI